MARGQAEILPKPIIYGTMEGEEGANVFFNLATAGRTDDLRRITDLKVVIDGSNWTDTTDDIMSIGLRTFAPFSDNLEHLHIVINGPFLFTRFNYIKPIVQDQVAFGVLRRESESDSGDSSHQPQTPKAKGPQKKANKLHEVTEKTKATLKVKEYKTRMVDAKDLDLHITAEKAIISALLCLKKPVSRISIHGYMELSLRRHLIAMLNPDWITSTHCHAHAGYAATDLIMVEDAEEQEKLCLETGREMVPMKAGATDILQDGEDFGMIKSQDTTTYGWPGWVVPTGKAGRQVHGWKAAAVHAWKGPTERGTR